MAQTKVLKIKPEPPPKDEIGPLPDILERWMNDRCSSVVVVEHVAGDRQVGVAWFDSRGNQHYHVGETDATAAKVLLDAWDLGSVIEQEIFRTVFPTWCRVLLESPTESVLEAFRPQEKGEDDGDGFEEFQ